MVKLEPKILNNVCITTHPQGVVADVKRQIDWIRQQPKLGAKRPARVLVIGGSGGFGLASRLISLFSAGAKTIGVGFDKSPSAKRPGTPGWYANLAADHYAQQAGCWSATVNADAFAAQTKEQVGQLISQEVGQIDLLVYSIASPARQDPEDGQLYRSVIKPIGQSFHSLGLDFTKRQLQESSIDPATEAEIQATVKVMGGEDWQLWVRYLQEQGLLASGFQTLSYSYIGPEHTHPIYTNGTIGAAKKHLQQTANLLDQQLRPLNGRAFCSINKALVTRASAVIPAVSLYIAILYDVMKKAGLHEECPEQIYRLFRERLYAAGDVPVDSQGLIRIDDWEMSAAIQQEVGRRWQAISQDNLEQNTDIDGYKASYLRIHGFAIEGIDYQAEVDPLADLQF